MSTTDQQRPNGRTDQRLDSLEARVRRLEENREADRAAARAEHIATLSQLHGIELRLEGLSARFWAVVSATGFAAGIGGAIATAVVLGVVGA